MPRIRWPWLAALLAVAAIAGIGYWVLQSRASAVTPLTPGTSWQWQLTGPLDETVLDGVKNPRKMYDIDLFRHSAETISRLRAKGIVVICYLSAGSAEDWRPDYHKFPESVKGRTLDGWPGETWLDIRQIDVLSPVIAARMDLARDKGCDGVEPDNIDAYQNDSGFRLSGAHQLAYNRHLASLAHSRGLSIGLKNDIGQIDQLVHEYDWALNEQCHQYDECDGYAAFTARNKAVFGVEYRGSTSDFCPEANASDYDWLRKDLDLTAKRTACREGRVRAAGGRTA